MPKRISEYKLLIELLSIIRRRQIMKKYISVYEKIKKDIVEGIYKKNTKLPSKRTLADLLGVSLITIEHAIELLDEEGYIECKEKSGYFVLYESGNYYGDSLIKDNSSKDASLNTDENSYNTVSTNDKSFEDNYFISYDIYAKTVRKVLSLHQDEILIKSPSFGNEKLRKSISDYLLRSRRIKVSPKQIIIGAGAEYLYGLIVRTFGNDVIYGIETPGYRKIKEVYQTDGAKVETLKLGKDGILRSELSKTKADILHVSPFRSYPTGVTASAVKKNEYIQWAKNNDGLIVEDDFESEYTPSKKHVDTIFSMENEGRVIYVNSFTRTIAPSVRMAYMLIPERMINLFIDKIGIYSCPVATLEQLTVSCLLDNGDFERHINKVRRNLRNK